MYSRFRDGMCRYYVALIEHTKGMDTLTLEQCAMIVGPPGNKRVEDCKLNVEPSEVQEYLIEGTAGAGLLVPKPEGVGYDLWYIRYSVPDSSIEPKYRVQNHISLAMTDENSIIYEALPVGDVIGVDILLESTRKAIGYDFITEKRVYESRPCATDDVGYALMHTLADLDRGYAHLLQEYEDDPNWFSAISLFLFVSTSALPMEDIEISEGWIPLHRDLLDTFQDGGLVNGDRAELDFFVETVGDLLLLIRKRLVDA